MVLGPQFQMPTRGTTGGDPSLPLYRQLDIRHDDPNFAGEVASAIRSGKTGKVANKLVGMATQGRLGSHWTHDIEQVRSYSDQSEHGDNVTSIILEAPHPGAEHVMSWDNPSDDKIMNQIVGGREYRNAVQPEVPIRPGTPMRINAVHSRGPVPSDPYAQDVDHRVTGQWQHHA